MPRIGKVLLPLALVAVLVPMPAAAESDGSPTESGPVQGIGEFAIYWSWHDCTVIEQTFGGIGLQAIAPDGSLLRGSLWLCLPAFEVGGCPVVGADPILGSYGWGNLELTNSTNSYEYELSRITTVAAEVGYGAVAVSGEYERLESGFPTGEQGYFDASFGTQGFCLSEYGGSNAVGSITLTPDGSSKGSDPPCSDPNDRVDRVQASGGGYEFETDIHWTDDEVMTCVTVHDNNGNVVARRVHRVSTDPDDPDTPGIQVDPNAPPGDDSDSPCTIEHFEGGSENARMYVRSSGLTSEPMVVCTGVRASGLEHHVRVTIEG